MINERAAILRWTGHPLVDAGTAALTAFAGKRDPETVTEDDLEWFASQAERWYFTPALSGYLTVLFTSNFMNPSWKPDQKRLYAGAVLRAFRWPTTDALPPCAYCGRTAARIANLCGPCNRVHHEPACPTCGKAATTLAYRDLVPLLTGRGTANFFPLGQHGLTLCGPCVVALQALAVGAPKCSGKALVVQAADPRLLLRLVRPWVNDTVRFVQLAEMGTAIPDIKAPQTRLVEALIRSEQEAADEDTGGGLVAYHLSNSGQGPGIQIYQLPSAVMRFLRRARSPRTAHAWSEIERRAWEAVGSGMTAADASDDERLQYRNYLYEDLFRLPEEAGRFIRIYFLRNAVGLVRANDPRAGYSLRHEADLVSWDLAGVFLEEVLNMEHNRIEAIRDLADRLAEEIGTDNDRRLFRNLYQVQDYRQARRLLIRANFRCLQRNKEPVLTFDGYLEIFEEGEELARVDWRLAWDLMLIRLIEQLHTRNKEVLSEVASEEEGEEAESVGAQV